MIHVFLYDSIYAYKLMDLRVIFLVVPKWGSEKLQTHFRR